jgi:hypothetical protein
MLMLEGNSMIVGGPNSLQYEDEHVIIDNMKTGKWFVFKENFENTDNTLLLLAHETYKYDHSYTSIQHSDEVPIFTYENGFGFIGVFDKQHYRDDWWASPGGNSTFYGPQQFNQTIGLGLFEHGFSLIDDIHADFQIKFFFRYDEVVMVQIRLIA